MDCHDGDHVVPGVMVWAVLHGRMVVEGLISGQKDNSKGRIFFMVIVAQYWCGEII